MLWLVSLSLFLWYAWQKSGSVSSNLWVAIVKNHHAPDKAATNSAKFQLLPETCCSLERDIFETLTLCKVSSSFDTSENYQLSESLGPRVRILVSVRGFPGCAFLTTRLPVVACTVG